MDTQQHNVPDSGHATVAAPAPVGLPAFQAPQVIPPSAALPVFPALPAPPALPASTTPVNVPVSVPAPVSVRTLQKRAADTRRSAKLKNRKRFIEDMWQYLASYIVNNIFLQHGVSGGGRPVIQAFIDSAITTNKGVVKAKRAGFSLVLGSMKNICNADACVAALRAGAVPAMRNALFVSEIYLNPAQMAFFGGLLTHWVDAVAHYYNAI